MYQAITGINNYRGYKAVETFYPYVLYLLTPFGGCAAVAAVVPNSAATCEGVPVFKIDTTGKPAGTYTIAIYLQNSPTNEDPNLADMAYISTDFVINNRACN